MVYARIFCFNCRGNFELYAENMNPDSPPANCPHCGSVLPTKPYKKLQDIVFQLADCEKDLRSAADTDGSTLFSISLENYHPGSGRKTVAR